MFSSPKKTQDGRYYVKSNEKKTVQINGVTIVSVSQDGMTLSVGSPQALFDVDAVILQSAKENCVAWFSRTVPDKTLEAAYTKSFSDGIMNVSKPDFHKVYLSKQVVGEDALTEGVACDVFLELSGISFTKKTFSPVWRIVQTRLKEPPKKKYHEEYLFQDEEEVSDDDLFA